MVPIGLTRLCQTQGLVTSGDKRLRVESGAMRFFVAGDHSHSAELAFTYQGPSKDVQLLASGELRRQVGIKLKAQDTCNVLYVMWQIEPSPGIHVSVKRNAGQSTYAACVDRGYINEQPTSSRRVPAITPGDSHTLRADLDGTRLRVVADGTEVWLGTLSEEVLAIDGPAGMRTDNGTFEFDLRVPGFGASAGGCTGE